ncbi:MAG: PKD domain-containing protein [Candidatus Pacebacteria bacterium]|nr:PKD domain-containing protein [Candidatus Paceibacterota bacterium]
MKKETLYLFLTISIIVAFFIPFDSYALLTPQVYLTEIQLNKDTFEPNQEITGTVNLWNYENYVVSDLYFNFQLMGEDVDNVPTMAIDEKTGNEQFTLLAGEKKHKNFSYRLPNNLPNGKLKLKVQIINSRGEGINWIYKEIIIVGGGRFLSIGNCWFLKEDLKFPTGTGVYYEPNAVPEVIFDIINYSSSSISAYPKIITYRRNSIEAVSEDKGGIVTFNPDDKKTQRLFLPKLERPESYLTAIRFYDSESNEPISNISYFRWIISGEDDAQILFVSSDKNSYEADEIAKIKVQITGPADPRVSVNSSDTEIKILDQNGKVVGEIKKETRFGELEIDVPIKSKVENPKIEVKITSNGKILDEYNFIVNSEQKTTEQIPFWQKDGFLTKFILFTILFIAVMIGFIYYFRNKKNKFLFILLAIFLGSLVFISNTSVVFSLVEVTEGCQDPHHGGMISEISISSPIPNLVINPGGSIPINGQVSVADCGNGLFFNKVTFYIKQDDNELEHMIDCCQRTIENCSLEGWYGCGCSVGCDNCYGATSLHYKACYPYTAVPTTGGWKIIKDENAVFCDQVKVLKTEGSNFIKLGECYPRDVLEHGPGTYIEYNQTPSVPSNLGFYGKARLYIQFSGLHASSTGLSEFMAGWSPQYAIKMGWGIWKWGIVYQDIYINKPPYTSSLSADSKYCVSEGIGRVDFKWIYNDEDVIDGNLDNQTQYNIQISEDQNFYNPIVDKYINQNVPPYNQGTSSVVVVQTPSSGLQIGYNKHYYWRIRVKDSNEAWSGWSGVNDFYTPSHPYPWPNFSSEQLPNTQRVKFTDETKFFDGNSGPRTWSWDFGDSTGSSLQNPVHFYSQSGSYLVKLHVVDSDGYSCPLEPRTISVSSTDLFNIPGWREIPPPIFNQGFLNTLFSQIFGFMPWSLLNI